MAVYANLIPVAALATALKLTNLDSQDAYAQMMISQASNAVRDFARSPGWVRLTEGSLPGVNQAEVPTSAQDITLQLAMRVYTNPRNLERRTAGPISETFRDTGIYGLGFTEDEKGRLGRMSPTGGSGIWVQPLDFGDDVVPILVPSITSYGVTDIGVTYLGTSDQFPYAEE